MKHTSKYSLSQWEETDRILMSDFNADNTRIENALTSLSGSVDTKATSAALNAETTARQNADNTINTALSKETSERKSADTAINNALALRGNCQLYLHSYKGDGETTRTFDFPHKPIAVFLPNGMQALYGDAIAVPVRNGGTTAAIFLSWGEKSLTLSGTPARDINITGNTYNIVALLAMDQ